MHRYMLFKSVSIAYMPCDFFSGTESFVNMTVDV